MERNCIDCAAYQVTSLGKAGECRNNSPTVGLNGGGYTVTRWPEVKAYDWCLQFTPKVIDTPKRTSRNPKDVLGYL